MYYLVFPIINCTKCLIKQELLRFICIITNYVLEGHQVCQIRQSLRRHELFYTELPADKWTSISFASSCLRRKNIYKLFQLKMIES